MISVVMPVYNGEKYLRKSIESVLNQTYTDFELVIVDDASKDSTPAIIEEYIQKDKRVRVIKNEKNMKLPKSLNIGFSCCNGDFFTWTSDDNIYYKNAFETLILQLKNTTVDFVFAREEYIDADGRYIGKQEDPRDLDELYCKSIMSGCFMYKKEVHEKLNGYDESKFLIEDYDFFRRAYKQFRFAYIPITLYSYRRHEGSLSETRMLEVRKRKVDLLEESLKDELPDRIKDKIYRELADSYYEISDLYKARLTAKNSIEYKNLRRLKVRSSIKNILKKLGMN